MKKTQAMRMLDKAGVPYEVHSYPVDPDKLEAQHVAHLLDIPETMVYKTLVVVGGPRGWFMAVIPGPDQLDLKAAAQLVGEKRVALLPVKELESVTGYIRGGVSPLGGRRILPVYAQSGIEHQECISISAGQRGLQIWLKGADLVAATQAHVAHLVIAASRPGLSGPIE